MPNKIRLRGKAKMNRPQAQDLITLNKSRVTAVSPLRTLIGRLPKRGFRGSVVVVRLGAAPAPFAEQKPVYADLLLSEPYDWGPQGKPAVKPFRYVPDQGWDTGEG